MKRKPMDIYGKTPKSIRAAWKRGKELWDEGVGHDKEENFVSALKKFQETLPIYEHLAKNHSIVNKLVSKKVLRESKVKTQEEFFNQELSLVREIIQETQKIENEQKLKKSKIRRKRKLSNSEEPSIDSKNLTTAPTVKKRKRRVQKQKEAISSEPDSKTETAQLSAKKYYVLFNELSKRFKRIPHPNTKPIPAKYKNTDKNTNIETPLCPTILLSDIKTGEIVGASFYHNKLPRKKRHFFYGEEFKSVYIFNPKISIRGQPLTSLGLKQLKRNTYTYVEFTTRYTCRSIYIPEGAIRIPATYLSESLFKPFEKLSADLVSFEGKIAGRIIPATDYLQLEPWVRIYHYVQTEGEKKFEFRAENYPNIKEEYDKRGHKCDSSMPPPSSQAKYLLPARKGDQLLKDLEEVSGKRLCYVEFENRYVGYYLGIPHGARIEQAKCLTVTTLNSKKIITVSYNKTDSYHKSECFPLVSLNDKIIGKIISVFEFPRDEPAIKLYEYGTEKRLFEVRQKNYANIMKQICKSRQDPYRGMSEQSRQKMQFYILGDKNSASPGV